MAGNGIPYFRLFCQQDDKLDLLEDEFGLTGFGVVIKLFMRIYGIEGYYCNWDDDVALSFASRVARTDVDTVQSIVQAAIRRDIFDKDMYERYGILTSMAVQKQCFFVYARRKSQKIKDEYLLLSDAENQIDVDRNGDSASKNGDSAYRNEQRTPKDTKPDDTKPDQTKGNHSRACDSGFDRFWEAYPNKKARRDAERAWKKLSPGPNLQKRILHDVTMKAASVEWTKEGGRFVPYPASYIRGERWNDEAASSASRYKNLQRLMENTDPEDGDENDE